MEGLFNANGDINMIESNRRFEEELKKLTDLGYGELHASCYIVNYYDDYICNLSGICERIDTCKEINKRLSEVI